MDDEQLASLYAEALNDAYTRLRRRYRPEFRGLSAKRMPALGRFGLILHRKKIDPYSYMQYVSDTHAGRTDDVYFNMIISEKTANAYLEDRADREEELKIVIELQTQDVDKRVERGDDLRTILTDYTAELSVVFRYAIAYSSGLTDLCEQFKEDASHMLVFEPLYKKLLSHSLPEELKSV